MYVTHDSSKCKDSEIMSKNQSVIFDLYLKISHVMCSPCVTPDILFGQHIEFSLVLSCFYSSLFKN